MEWTKLLEDLNRTNSHQLGAVQHRSDITCDEMVNRRIPLCR